MKKWKLESNGKELNTGPVVERTEGIVSTQETLWLWVLGTWSQKKRDPFLAICVQSILFPTLRVFSFGKWASLLPWELNESKKEYKYAGYTTTLKLKIYLHFLKLAYSSIYRSPVVSTHLTHLCGTQHQVEHMPWSLQGHLPGLCQVGQRDTCKRGEMIEATVIQAPVNEVMPSTKRPVNEATIPKRHGGRVKCS